MPYLAIIYNEGTLRLEHTDQTGTEMKDALWNYLQREFPKVRFSERRISSSYVLSGDFEYRDGTIALTPAQEDVPADLYGPEFDPEYQAHLRKASNPKFRGISLDAYCEDRIEVWLADSYGYSYYNELIVNLSLYEADGHVGEPQYDADRRVDEVLRDYATQLSDNGELLTLTPDELTPGDLAKYNRMKKGMENLRLETVGLIPSLKRESGRLFSAILARLGF